MDETTQDGSEVLETTEVEETTENDELTPEQIAELKAKAAEADELREKNKQLFERAKKAEGSKVTKTEGEVQPTLSIKDQAFLAKADIHEDDLDEVLEWAAFKGIGLKEAYTQIKPTLDVKAEQRQTAQASNVSNVRRGQAKVSDEALLEKAAKGSLPETDDDIERLVSAKMRQK